MFGWLGKKGKIRPKANSKAEANVFLFSFDAKAVPDAEAFRRLVRDQSALKCITLAFLKRSIRDNGHNLVTDYGTNQFSNLIAGINTNFMQYCGVGSGTNTPLNTDTDLQTAIGSRKQTTNNYVINNVIHVDTFYASGDNNGSWNEVILSHASSGANASARYKLGTTYTKALTNTAVVAWVITITAI